jgi:hypothetical protein
MDPLKDKQIEKVHTAQNEQHQTDLVRQNLDAGPGVRHFTADLEREADVPEIDQVEPDHEQMVDGVRERRVTVENLDKEYSSILVKRSSDPHCQ